LVFANLFKNFLSLFPVCNFDNTFMLKINLRINFIKLILAHFTPIIRLTQTNYYQLSQVSGKLLQKFVLVMLRYINFKSSLKSYLRLSSFN